MYSLSTRLVPLIRIAFPVGERAFAVARFESGAGRVQLVARGSAVQWPYSEAREPVAIALWGFCRPLLDYRRPSRSFASHVIRTSTEHPDVHDANVRSSIRGLTT